MGLLMKALQALPALIVAMEPVMTRRRTTSMKYKKCCNKILLPS